MYNNCYWLIDWNPFDNNTWVILIDLYVIITSFNIYNRSIIIIILCLTGIAFSSCFISQIIFDGFASRTLTPLIANGILTSCKHQLKMTDFNHDNDIHWLLVPSLTTIEKHNKSWVNKTVEQQIQLNMVSNRCRMLHIHERLKNKIA